MLQRPVTSEFWIGLVVMSLVIGGSWAVSERYERQQTEAVIEKVLSKGRSLKIRAAVPERSDWTDIEAQGE